MTNTPPQKNKQKKASPRGTRGRQMLVNTPDKGTELLGSISLRLLTRPAPCSILAGQK